MTPREKVFDDIDAERREQNAQWGGEEHDDEHIAAEWCGFIAYQCRQMVKPQGLRKARARMVKIAALAVAAIESFDRRIEHDPDEG